MSQTVQAQIDQALVHHSAGRLAEAEAIYRQILTLDPTCPAALHLLGVAQSQQGNKLAGADLITRAIALNPTVPEFHANLALVFIEDGRPDMAIPCAQRAVKLNANDADSQNRLGNALRLVGRMDEAIAALQTSLRLRPDFPDALHNLSLALLECGRVEEAASYSQRATARGADPNMVLHLGRVLHKQRKFTQAIAEYEKVLATGQMVAEVQNNLGAVYQDMGRIDEAIEFYRKALAVDASHAGAHNNLGFALSTLGKTEEAMACYHKSLESRPDSPDTYNNLANAFRDQLDVDRALACYDKALFFSANHADAHWNRSILWLLAGDFARGWPEYEWRWVRFPEERRGFAPPRWDGADIAGKSILLHAEQGLGDTIQFARYAPQIAATGATVYLECQAALVPLLRQLPGVSRVIAKGESPPAFDMHSPLLSLPHAMGTTLKSIPAEVPYITPDAGLVRLWSKKLGEGSEKKVGLAWAGSTIHPRDRERSIPLEKLAPLFALPNVRFVSLQKQLPARDEADVKKLGLFDATSELRDFADTAALVANLDLVICVDTAAAHLAGAMGKPVWIMLPFNPDWRWLLGRNDSPWYSTARLFRQPAAMDWDSVISQVAKELASFEGS